jgi:hypothetical protein
MLEMRAGDGVVCYRRRALLARLQYVTGLLSQSTRRRAVARVDSG